MGATTRWLRSLIGIKKPIDKRSDEGKDILKSSTSGKSKRWSVWKLGSEKHREEDRGRSFRLWSSNRQNLQASVKQQAVIKSKEQCAAIRIQSAFRRFLARRAFRALRALVRIQAIFRGRRVRKQAAMAKRCMEALIKVQALVRARGVRMSREGRAVQQRINQRRVLEAQILERTEGRRWCDSLGTAEEIQTRFRHKVQAAIKRERALQYALYHQTFRSKSCQQQRCHPDNYNIERLEDQEVENAFKNDTNFQWLEEELKKSKDIELKFKPQITIPYTGPIFSHTQIHPSAVPPSSELHPNNSRVQRSPLMECKSERWSPCWSDRATEWQVGSMKPGYMQATESVRAKSKTLCTESKLQLALDDFYSQRRRCSRPPPRYLDTQKLFVPCN